MAHTSSKTWISHEAREAERFEAFQAASRRKLFLNTSPFIPKDLTSWITQRTEMHDATIRRDKRSIAAREEQRRLARQGVPPLRQAFDGKVFPENQGAVLSEFTIWCPNWDMPWRPRAPWPGLKEAQLEGDDRNKTNVGRFLPLPRQPGNPTVTFNHIPMVYSFPFDQVRKVPTMEDVYLPVDEIDEDVIPNLLNKELLEELDPGDIFL